MSRLMVLFGWVFCALSAAAQPSWQQHVSYEIDVTLDDQNHILSGRWKMEYTNNSPDPLDYIYIHLWPNAYRSGETALAEQLLENGNKKLYYAPKEERGWIDSLNFQMDGKACTLELTEDPDVGMLRLPAPIASGTTVTFTTPFRAKIPGDFSRLGHEGNAYQISQWYPKPAVYDQNGWHPIPYLNQGEFYSEYGNFDVRITLPENYVVGATGVLQSKEERQWLLSKADTTNQLLKKKEITSSIPIASSPNTKTIEYRAENVHDFAWFADKRYLVQHDTALIANQVVDIWSLFTADYAKQWAQSTTYIKNALHFYSQAVGPYQYPQCTAVEGTLSAGAGMEYPMITILGSAASGDAMERVTVHEVGHNWFYSMLGSNERLYPWMDEGINSYYEYRYFKERYPKKTVLPEEANKSERNFLGLANLREEDLYKKVWVHQYLVHENQPISLPAPDYTTINYGVGVYAGTAFLFEHMAAYVGQEQFDRAMHVYFEKWRGHHPYPGDFIQILQHELGKRLDWAFEGQLMEAKPQDFKFEHVEKHGDTLRIETKDATNSGAPYPVQQMVHGNVVREYWVTGDTLLQVKKSRWTDQLAIDHNRVTLDLNRGNNTYRFHGLWKKTRTLALRGLGGIEQDDIQAIYFAPVPGWNNYDRWMVGVAFFNSLFPQRAFHFRAIPLFGFGSKSVVGAATLEQDIFFGKGLFHHWQLALAGQTFHDDIVRGEWLRYYKVNPSLSAYFRKPSARSPSQHSLTLSSTHINRERLRFQSSQEFRKIHETYNFQRLTYLWEKKTTLSPFTQEVTLERQDKYLKLWWDGHWRISNDFLRKDIRIRTFIGGFLDNRLSEPWESIFEFPLSNTTGRLDYGYDNLYLGRTDQTGLTYMQQYTGGAGMKVRADKFPFGTAGEFLASANVTVPLPIPLLAVFGDVALRQGVKSSFWFSEAGVAIILIPEVAEIYLPIVMDRVLRQAFVSDTDNYFQRVTFLLNLNKLNPLKLVRSISLNDF